MRLHWSSERTIRVEVAEAATMEAHRRVRAAYLALRSARIPGVADLTPAYTTVTISFDLAGLDAEAAEHAARSAIGSARSPGVDVPPPRVVEVPVRYGGEWGPDLEDVARHAGLGEAEVIRLHSSGEYTVAFIGFSPGFPYLLGMPPELAMPRLERPRTRIAAGSVGIAGGQTGIYPQATPGGWRIIGRTGLRLYDPGRAAPTLLEMGDRVRFVPVDPGSVEEMERRSDEAGAGDIELLSPGVFTSVQGGARFGLSDRGIPEGGALDAVSLARANGLLGNAADAPGLELTLTGPALRFAAPARVAIVGASGIVESATGEKGSLEPDGEREVRAGDVLHLGRPELCRAYLAVAGGVGGPEGRLRAGDRLAMLRLPVSARSAEPASRSSERPGVLRVVAAPHSMLPEPVRMRVLSDTFTVGDQSNRTGLRLRTGSPVPHAGGRMITEAMPTGTIQLPPEGQPIILMNDRPTTGGYPVVATVIAADLHRAGQLRPREEVRFETVTLEEARGAWGELMSQLQVL